MFRLALYLEFKFIQLNRAKYQFKIINTESSHEIIPIANLLPDRKEYIQLDYI